MITQTNTHLSSLLIIVLLVLLLRTAFSNNLLHSFFHTEAKARVTLYLRDEQDRPVTNAIIVVGYLPVGANNYQRTEYIPDKKGYVTIQEKSIEPIGGYIRAAGFYQSVFSLRDKREHEVKNMIKNHCWLPWDSKKEIVLREVRNPIPMFATIFDKFP